MAFHSPSLCFQGEKHLLGFEKHCFVSEKHPLGFEKHSLGFENLCFRFENLCFRFEKHPLGFETLCFRFEKHPFEALSSSLGCIGRLVGRISFFGLKILRAFWRDPMAKPKELTPTPGGRAVRGRLKVRAEGTAASLARPRAPLQAA